MPRILFLLLLRFESPYKTIGPGVRQAGIKETQCIHFTRFGNSVWY